MESVKCEKAYAPPPAQEGSRPVVLEVLYISRKGDAGAGAGGQPWYSAVGEDGAWENWVSEWLFPHLHGFLGTRVELRLICLSYTVEEAQWLATNNTDGPLLQWSISTLYQLQRLHQRYTVERLARRASSNCTSFSTMAPRRIAVLLCHGADAFLGKMLAYTASVQYRDFTKSLRGVVFFAAPHSATSLSNYTEIVRALLGIQPEKESETLKLAATCLASLTSMFDTLAKASGTRVLNFGTAASFTDIPVLRGKEMVSSSIHGEYQECDADFSNITHFTDRDDLTYVRTLSFIRSVCGLLGSGGSNTRRKSHSVLVTSPGAGAAKDDPAFTIVLRGYKTLYAAKRDHSSKEDWASLPTRAPGDILERIEYENLFVALVSALAAIQKARDDSLGSLQAALLAAENTKGLELHLVGNERQVLVARAVVLHIACVPPSCAAIHSHFLAVPCPYDMQYSLPHVSGVARLLKEWDCFSGSSALGKAVELRQEALKFKARPLRISLLGRSGGGQVAFVNSLLSRPVLASSHMLLGTVVELCEVPEGQEEKIRVSYLPTAVVSDLQMRTVVDLKQLQHAVEGFETDIAELGQGEESERSTLEAHLQESQARLADMRAFQTQVNKYLNRVTAGEAGSEVVDIAVKEWDMRCLLKERLERDAAVISSVSVYIKSALLSQVVLIVPPALDGRHGSNYRDAMNATQRCDGWIYLMAATGDLESAKSDLGQLSGRSQLGNLCVTGTEALADSASSLSSIREKLGEELSRFLVNIDNVALVSCALSNALVCEPLDDAKRKALGEKLVATVIGASLDNLAAGRPGIMDALQSCASSNVSADQLWKDFALEGSSLLFTLALSFEMIETGIVVKEFGGLLHKASAFLSKRLYDVCDRIEDLSQVVESVQGAKAGQQKQDKKNQLLSKEHNLRTMGEEFSRRWERGIDAFEQQFSCTVAEVYAFVTEEVAKGIANHKRSASRKVIKRMLRKVATEVTVSVSLVAPVMDRLSTAVEQSLQRNLSGDLDSLLLDIFPQEADLRQSIRSHLGSGGEGERRPSIAGKIPLGTFSCIESSHLIQTSLFDSKDKCTKPFLEDAKRRVDHVFATAKNTLTQALRVVEQEVQVKLKEYADRLKQLEEHSKNKAAAASLPAGLLQTRLDLLLREEQQMLRLFSSVSLLSIPNAIHGRQGTGTALILRVDKLSQAEENALSFAFWLLARGDLDSMPKHLIERSRAPFVGPGVMPDLIVDEIFNSYGARLVQVKLEHWFEEPQPILVVESADMFVLRTHTAERWLRCDLAGRQETISLGTACSILVHPAVRLLFVMREL